MIWPGRRLLPGVAAAAGMEAGFAVSGADPSVKEGGHEPRTAAVSIARPGRRPAFGQCSVGNKCTIYTNNYTVNGTVPLPYSVSYKYNYTSIRYTTKERNLGQRDVCAR